MRLLVRGSNVEMKERFGALGTETEPRKRLRVRPPAIVSGEARNCQYERLIRHRRTPKSQCSKANGGWLWGKAAVASLASDIEAESAILVDVRPCATHPGVEEKA